MFCTLHTYDIHTTSECSICHVHSPVICNVDVQRTSIFKNQISFKKCLIYDHKAAMSKYGKWEKFEEQLATMENELSILENQLANKLKSSP